MHETSERGTKLWLAHRVLAGRGPRKELIKGEGGALLSPPPMHPDSSPLQAKKQGLQLHSRELLLCLPLLPLPSVAFFSSVHASPDPQRDLKIRSLEPYGKLYKDYIGFIMCLYRGSNFSILPGVWVHISDLVLKDDKQGIAFAGSFVLRRTSDERCQSEDWGRTRSSWQHMQTGLLLRISNASHKMGI